MELIKNEFTKAINKKFTLILVAFAIISLFVSYFLVTSSELKVGGSFDATSRNEFTIINGINSTKQNINSAKTDEEKEIYNRKLEVYEYVNQMGIENILGIEYKRTTFNSLLTAISSLSKLDKVSDSKKYNEQEEKISSLWKLLKEGTFEEYIEFNKAEIKSLYENGEITEDDYINRINNEEQNLKYGIGKYSSENSHWKSTLSGYTDISEDLKYNYDFDNNIYLDDKGKEKLINQKLIAEYRLENNLEPHYADSVWTIATEETAQKNIRYRYSKIARLLSMFFVGLLAVYLGASCVSEEKSKGTIKFLLVTPKKRYKILLAKILNIVIIIVVTTLIISQLNILLANILFKGATNEYLYVKNGEVKVMSTYLYETLTYVLKIPEIIIYMLIGVACSVLMKNKISNIIATTIYVVITLGIQYLLYIAPPNNMDINGYKLFPFFNLDLSNNILPLTTFEKTSSCPLIPASISVSLITILVIATLLLITAFDGFRKKEI